MASPQLIDKFPFSWWNAMGNQPESKSQVFMRWYLKSGLYAYQIRWRTVGFPVTRSTTICPVPSVVNGPPEYFISIGFPSYVPWRWRSFGWILHRFSSVRYPTTNVDPWDLQFLEESSLPVPMAGSTVSGGMVPPGGPTSWRVYQLKGNLLFGFDLFGFIINIYICINII